MELPKDDVEGRDDKVGGAFRDDVDNGDCRIRNGFFTADDVDGAQDTGGLMSS